MDHQRRRLLFQLVLLFLRQHPDIDDYQRLIVNLISILRCLPPDRRLDIRNRLFDTDNVNYNGRDVFRFFFAGNRYNFFHLTGETPETLIALVNSIDIPDNNILSMFNRFLLLFPWLRKYPCYGFVNVSSCVCKK